MTSQKKITIVLLLFSAFCVSMEVARIQHSHYASYIFLIWNLILAWVPYFFSLRFSALDIYKHRLKAAAIFILWILFLPNAAYIITDLVHLRERMPVPLWYDIFLVIAYAWLGLLLALLSMRNMHKKLEDVMPAHWLWVGIFIVFLSSGYGIYVGRFLRWNSWDVFIRPLHLLHYSFHELIHPIQHINVVLMTVIICAIQFFSYAMIHFIDSTHELKTKP